MTSQVYNKTSTYYNLHSKPQVVSFATLANETIKASKDVSNLKMKIAKNGEEGLALLEQQDHPLFSGKPDIILLDMNMPRMNGIEFLQTLRNSDEWRNIKVFVLTTSDQSEDERIMRSLGISGYITKPLKMSNTGSIDAFNLMIDLMNM